MSLNIYKNLVFIFLFALTGNNVRSQDRRALSIDPVLWAKVEAKLQQTPPPATYEFIPQLVEAHFSDQPDSLYPAYYAVMIRLERLFNLNAAIRVGEEMAEVAKAQHNPAGEATAYTELARYYDAAGIYQLSVLNNEKALAIHQTLEDKKAILLDKFYIILRKLDAQIPSEISSLETLLSQAVAMDMKRLVKRIHLSLMEQNFAAGKYQEAEKHVAYLENLPVSTPVRPEEYPYLINATYGRATLALASNNLAEAERYYLNTLRLCREEPGPWFEIFTLHNLTNLELKRGKLIQAKAYLEAAQTKAERLQLDDLLTETYALKTRIAERENKPADALRFLKQKLDHEAKFKARSAGFNLKNFYLQAERDRLATTEKNTALELSLRESQLSYSIIVLSLLALLAVGLVLAFVYQRRRKAELAHKNALIQQQADELKSLDAAKSRFFANVSHELRTPLSLIVGPITTLLKETAPSEKHSVLLKAAHRSARQLESLVKDLLDLRNSKWGRCPCIRNRRSWRLILNCTSSSSILWRNSGRFGTHRR